MKKYINIEGKQIFKLDYEGNMEIAGNLTLGDKGVLKAETIVASNNNNIIIIRDPEEMKTPYKK
jgi:hypothetical protein